MKKLFKCPKCNNDSIVETIEHIIEYRTFWEVDEDNAPDYEDEQFDYDEAQTLDFTCEKCGFWLGDDLDEVVEKYFKEVEE
jgi:transcription initiation factor IIE alpha subunit